MYEIEVKYINGVTEIFNDVMKYEAICDGRLIRIEHAYHDVMTMIPTSQLIRIGKKRDEVD